MEVAGREADRFCVWLRDLDKARGRRQPYIPNEGSTAARLFLLYIRCASPGLAGAATLEAATGVLGGRGAVRITYARARWKEAWGDKSSAAVSLVLSSLLVRTLSLPAVVRFGSSFAFLGLYSCEVADAYGARTRLVASLACVMRGMLVGQRAMRHSAAVTTTATTTAITTVRTMATTTTTTTTLPLPLRSRADPRAPACTALDSTTPPPGLS